MDHFFSMWSDVTAVECHMRAHQTTSLHMQ